VRPPDRIDAAYDWVESAAPQSVFDAALGEPKPEELTSSHYPVLPSR